MNLLSILLEMSPELKDQIERMHAEDGPNYNKKGDKGDLTVSSQEEVGSVLDMIGAGDVNVDKVGSSA